MVTETNTLLIAFIALFVVVIALIIHLEWRLRRILRGHKTETIEDSIALIERDIKGLMRFKTEVSGYLAQVEKRLGRSVQGIGTVRFNPFKGEGLGGNQSFASSFLSEKGDGLIISSIYSRDRASTYAKPVKDFKSVHELSGEEKEAIKLAQEKLRV